MIYLISYDLPRGLLRPSREPLLDEIVSPPTRDWMHYLDKTWLVSTPETVDDLNNRLGQWLRPNDKLLVVEFSRNFAGFLPEDAWDWVNERIDAGDLYS